MRESMTQTGRARGGFKLMPIKRRSFPLWLLRDVPALMGLLASFWTLVIFAMTSARKAATAADANQSIRDRFALLLALAEARLDYALWRQAYRRIGWRPRGLTLGIFPPSTDWSYTQKRLRDFAHAFRNMKEIVDAYVDHIRKRFGISQRELIAHGSTGARLRRVAHHELVCVAASPFALILSSARSARPSKHERGHADARGPPLHLTQNQPQPTSHASRARSHRRAYLPRSCAARSAKYVITPLAPARLNADIVSMMARSSSSQPCAAAALICAYSPEIWNTSVGTPNSDDTRCTISR